MSYIDVTGKYTAIKFLPSGNLELSLEIPASQKQSVLSGIDEIMQAGNPELIIKIAKKRDKRSKNANDYLWVLCGKIADKLQGVTKEDVYRRNVEQYGKYSILAIQEDAVQDFAVAWALNGIAWFARAVDSKLDGCKKVFAYYGSSTYDTREMSRLLDGVIQDAKALGIETMPPNELAAMMEEWKKCGK